MVHFQAHFQVQVKVTQVQHPAMEITGGASSCNCDDAPATLVLTLTRREGDMCGLGTTATQCKMHEKCSNINNGNGRM